MSEDAKAIGRRVLDFQGLGSAYSRVAHRGKAKESQCGDNERRDEATASLTVRDGPGTIVRFGVK
jgi:hypothetical protein